MNSTSSNPAFWRLSTLLSLENEQVHELACWAVGTLTSYRLILGRCLLVMDRSKAYKEFGCSTAIHYGSAKLGLSTRVARECRRIARLLLELPQLTLAAERGTISWSKLREVVRVAAPHTEEYWLELAARHDSATLQNLVKRTPFGELPGDVENQEARNTEFRCAASPQLIQMFQQARRMFSLERDEALTGADTLECLLAAFFSHQPLDSEVMAKVRDEADKDLQAEAARQLPLVEEARELAREMGLVSDSESSEEKICGSNCACDREEREDSLCLQSNLARALGGEVERLSGVILETESQGIWQNTRLRFNPDSRHTTRAQKKEILRRDAWCCSTPGCPNKVWLDIHHLEPYSEGGRTVKENLLSLCTGCHRNVHQGLLRISPGSDGGFEFTDQEGRELRHQANLELAAWIDFWMGWRNGPNNSHQMRTELGSWAVF